MAALVLLSADEHYRRQQRIVAAGVLAARKARQTSLDQLVRIVTAYQLVAVREAAASIEPMLVEQGITSAPAGTVAATSLAGYATDGRTLNGLFAMATTDYMFDLMAANQIQGMARYAESIATTVNYGAEGYVRMLNPPSCARCAVLAGKFYRWSSGFRRHPNCDCVHIPSTENLSGDLRTDPQLAIDNGLIQRRYTYTDANGNTTTRMVNDLTRDQLRALEDGGDVSQVINIGRSPLLRDSYSFGRSERRSTESTTRFGLAYRQRTGRRSTARLTPYSIYRVAESREQAIQLLKVNGFIL